MVSVGDVAQQCLSSNSPVCPSSRALLLLEEAQRERGADKSLPAGALSPTTAHHYTKSSSPEILCVGLPRISSSLSALLDRNAQRQADNEWARHHDGLPGLVDRRMRSLILPDVAASHKAHVTIFANSYAANTARSPSPARCAPRYCLVGTCTS
jgi:hypothetical protein